MTTDCTDTLDLFGGSTAPDTESEPRHLQKKVSQVSHMSQPSNGGASSRDISQKRGVPGCPIGHEENAENDDGEPEAVREPKRPSFATYLTRTQYGPPGLYYHGQRQPKGDNDPEPFDEWVCSPIECLAATHDERGDNHGLLLWFTPPYGARREWAMPQRLLKGNGEELRGELLDMGVRINPDAHRRLNKWLAQATPEARVIAATRVGWHQLEEGRVFVMPRRSIAAGALGSRITFQSEHAGQGDYATAGTLESWRRHVGTLCSGNPLLVLAVSAALAGPLLYLTHRQTAGIHLVGDSSNGKTTALEVAASVWGSPEFKRTWRATGNGLEGIAAALSDTALVLDEIGEADGREIGATVYALGNGTGKARASRIGNARRPHRWRIAVLSSGEHTLAAHMSEAGKRPKAGQMVRLLDIPATRQHGAFDDLHHLADGRAFADHLKTEVAHHYGHLGPAFIERLVVEERDLAGEVDRFAQLDGFTTSHPLQGRAAKVLALIGLAGELAAEYGLASWQEGEAMAAAVEAFQAWAAGQGGVRTEHEQILANVSDFIGRHGDARFGSVNADPDHPGHTVHNRAGWWRDDAQGRAYLFTTGGLTEALGGFDLKRGLDALEAAGWIVEREANARSVRVRVNSGRPRLFAIRPTDGKEEAA
ncbi:putative DNA primase/helicase [Chromohalobacter canadensis]|uniref:Putative DNA primase/helicase n=1 Tax=Chromohalobacter canadensis TaxID=141389 RepID=A0A285VES2_9GAMM|nr:DUF927 domain-containing protein [Chromohalobacter canadensis]SOC51011.1 putative DNA primase/helicase [Chromohalobacter canadensis]